MLVYAADAESPHNRPCHAWLPFVVAMKPAASNALATAVGVGHLYNLVVPPVHLPSEAAASFFLPRVTCGIGS